ncbi:hypothetical protein FY528_14795 [Hymenobacter lutimineralis]|uniref:Tetratricopeptide repeat protein n=1 Tax=Hymenobacter lutimineralis TaxID=2606448 RepID=A0A5D6UX69_9BACT|nr:MULTISPECIES: hypothetical protein [Hymenobacter]QIX62769.1 hypothetical protein HER32_16960 [Hymenobacter sp. BT18]TYZ07625.1 hypothetical protein FY528_14795 [Hymenobacter lutimineralis]
MTFPRFLFLILLLTFSTPVSLEANPYDVAQLRRHYQQAAASKEAGEKFHKLMASYTQQDAVVLAYKAAAEAIRARDASMFNKLTYVQNASKQFEQAVKLDRDNAEIRFLRLSVESNLPGFLGLSQHVDEDRAFLVSTLLKHPNSGLDAESFGLVRNFLVDRGHVSGPEAEKLARL